MKVIEMNFEQVKEQFKEQEGLVLLGCGGDLNEWIDGVTEVLNEEGITKIKSAKKLWSKIYTMTTTGGRIDLLLLFNNPSNLDIGKMAMWRLRFGDASWWSDYMVNYAKHHGDE